MQDARTVSAQFCDEICQPLFVRNQDALRPGAGICIIRVWRECGYIGFAKAAAITGIDDDGIRNAEGAHFDCMFQHRNIGRTCALPHDETGTQCADAALLGLYDEGTRLERSIFGGLDQYFTGAQAYQPLCVVKNNVNR